MASLWDGNGNVVRTDGTRSGATTWAQADAANVDILSADHDTHDEGLADSIEKCLNIDGENSMNADLDLGGNFIANHGGWKVKTALTGRNSTTTLADDPHLAGWSLDGSSYYSIEGMLYVTADSTTPDFKGAFQTSSAFTASHMGWISNQSAIVVKVDLGDAVSGTFAVEFTGAVTTIVHVSGFIVTNSAATVDFQWAQNTSDSDFTYLNQGSWIRLEKL